MPQRGIGEVFGVARPAVAPSRLVASGRSGRQRSANLPGHFFAAPLGHGATGHGFRGRRPLARTCPRLISSGVPPGPEPRGHALTTGNHRHRNGVSKSFVGRSAALYCNSSESSRAARILRSHGRPVQPANSSLPIPVPKFPCPIRPHSRTAASRPSRWASAVRLRDVSIGSFLLCVPSDLCGVPLRAATIGAFPENTAEIGRNAERERAEARTAYSLRRLAEFCLHPCRPMYFALAAAPPPCTTTLQNPRAPRGFSLERGCVRGAPAAAAGSQGTARISPVACGDSGPLRLVLGGHSRAPWVGAPPLCVHRSSVVTSAFATA